MTEDEREDRIVVAFERLAEALTDMSHAVAGIYDIKQREFAKQYPAREKREALVSRVPTDEDRIREQHGASDEPITGWLDIDRAGPIGYIGRREHEFISKEKGAESPDLPRPGGGSAKAAEGPAT